MHPSRQNQKKKFILFWSIDCIGLFVLRKYPSQRLKVEELEVHLEAIVLVARLLGTKSLERSDFFPEGFVCCIH